MIALADKLRNRHVHILGKTQCGKTTLMLNMARQDMERGRGVVFIDPHGDPSELFLTQIPHARTHESYYFEPVNYPVGLGSLSASSGVERDYVVDDILTLFRRTSEGWGDRMDAVLRYTVAALLSVQDSTFLDIHHFLSNDSFRQMKVAALPDGDIRNYWTREFPKLPKDAASFITFRTAKFATSEIMAPILGSPDTVDFANLMDGGNILVVNLGRLGEDMKAVLGTLILSRLQVLALRRAAEERSRRTPVYLFVDEFQEFALPTTRKILSQAAKFRLHLTVAHQDLAQLDEKTRSSIGNAGATILFQLSPEDIPYYERVIGYEPPKQKHWVGASGERTMEVRGHGVSPRNLKPHEVVIVADGLSFFSRTFPLPPGHDSAPIKARMAKLSPFKLPSRNVSLEVVEPLKSPEPPQ